MTEKPAFNKISIIKLWKNKKKFHDSDMEHGRIFTDIRKFAG